MCVIGHMYYKVAANIVPWHRLKCQQGWFLDDEPEPWQLLKNQYSSNSGFTVFWSPGLLDYFYSIFVTPRHYCFIHNGCTPSIFSVTRSNWVFGLADGNSEAGTAGAHATPRLSGETVTAVCGALGNASMDTSADSMAVTSTITPNKIKNTFGDAYVTFWDAAVCLPDCIIHNAENAVNALRIFVLPKKIALKPDPHIGNK